jgi:dTDP-4-amino-4,6-dideoxygalactose transaminase
MTYKSIVHNPFKVVRMFEEEVAEYTGAPYAVAVDSCTNALFLCCVRLSVKEVIIPKMTYLSVPMSIMHAGGSVVFEDREWVGSYQLRPYPLYDSAKRLTSRMYIPGSFMCLSFHIKKHVKLAKGGMILTDDKDAVEWFKRARYEGRGEVDYHKDDIRMLGWNMYMTPEQAAHGLNIMLNYPEHMEDIGENDGYRDLSQLTIFKDCRVL